MFVVSSCIKFWLYNWNLDIILHRPSLSFVLFSSCQKSLEVMTEYQICFPVKVKGLGCEGSNCEQDCWLEVGPCKGATHVAQVISGQVDPGMGEPPFCPDNYKEMWCHHHCHGDWVSPGVWHLHLTVGTEKISMLHPEFGPQIVPKHNK